MENQLTQPVAEVLDTIVPKILSRVFRPNSNEYYDGEKIIHTDYLAQEVLEKGYEELGELIQAYLDNSALELNALADACFDGRLAWDEAKGEVAIAKYEEKIGMFG